VPAVARRFCNQSRCPSFAVFEGRCAAHQRSKERTSSADWHHLYDTRWQRYRLTFLAEHPLCVECRRNGQLFPATVVDHVKPHRGDYELFWDPSNHQGLCRSCHDRKTATEDGGFGNRHPRA
jgi:5-methylcytosine-specific restriction enzyme A